MIQAQGTQHIVVRMVDGEDLVTGLLDVEIGSAAIVAGIGMVRDVRLGYWNGSGYEDHHIAEPAELLAMQGNVALQDDRRVVHCHLTIARRDGTVAGGHLLAATVANTAEIVLERLNGIVLERRPEPSGLVGLHPRS